MHYEGPYYRMNKNYNYKRRKLLLPEYGRHIQEMVDSLLLIEDRAERTRQAKAVIAVMGNLNPLLRDTADFTHKLWDHMFIMSDFQLDVDSPYPQPSRQDLMIHPEPLSYPQSYIRFKHYGKYASRMVRSMAGRTADEVAASVCDISRHMRAKCFEYNQEHPNSEVIIKDIQQMAGGDIALNEETLTFLRSDHKQNYSAHGSHAANNRNAKHQQRNNKNNAAQGKARQKNNSARHNNQK